MPATCASFGRSRAMISSAVDLRARLRLELDEHRAGVAGDAVAAADERDDVRDVGIGLHDGVDRLLPLRHRRERDVLRRLGEAR